MPKFTYVSKDARGQKVTAVADAASRRELLTALKERGLTVVEVHETDATTKASEPKKSSTSTKKFRLFGARSGELVIFWRQFSTMVAAGMPLIEALESIEQELEGGILKEALHDMIADVWEGMHLSQSMKKHPRVFSSMVVSLIGAAEESGSLTAVATQFADYLENRDRIIAKVRAALTYPVFLVVFFVGVAIFSTVWVIPKFKDIYESFHAKLPPLTLFVFAVNSFLLKYAWHIVAFVVLLVILFILWARTSMGRSTLDRLSLSLPIVGTLLKRAATAKFCRSLTVLLGGGIAINRAMELAENTTGNSLMAKAIRNAREDILKGGRIAASLRKQDIFPRLAMRMISSGEATGNLTMLLEKTAEFYEGRVDAALASINSLIEPIIIVMMGGFVLVFVMALYMPIFSLASTMRA